MKQSRVFAVWSYIAMAIFAVAVILNVTGAKASAAGEFVTTWKTDVSDPTDASITIPTYPGQSYSYDIDWGDGNTETNVTGGVSHTYASPGTYSVKISNTFSGLHLNNHADAPKIQSVEAWGSIAWASMTDAFQGASNLVINATDAPDLSIVTSLSGMFSGASSVNQPINHWNVSNVNNFSYMFESASSFNQALGGWDVSAAQSFLGLFSGASSFNQNINTWSVQRNSSINSMFQGASDYNQPLNNWDVSNVLDTRFAFEGATAFNQDLSSWRLPQVQKMEFMFKNASSFDQNVGDWNIASLQRADYMFQGSGLSPANYDSLLAGWRQGNPNDDVVFFGIDTTYCNGLNDRSYLVDTLNWYITDAGFDPSTCGPTDIYLVGLNDPTVTENQDGGPIGTLASVDVDNDATHVYSLTCRVDYPDMAYFAINDDELSSTTAFDFDAPLDTDGDSVYQICVTSIDKNGYSIEKEFLITVLEDQQEFVVDDGEVLGINTPEQNGFTSATPESNGEVLSSHSGETLASTGISMASYLTTGLLLVGLAFYLLRSSKGRVIYKILRQQYEFSLNTMQSSPSMTRTFIQDQEPTSDDQQLSYMHRRILKRRS